MIPAVKTWPCSWLHFAVPMLFWLAGATAAAAVDEHADRELVRQQRQQIEARYQESMKQCADKFRITDCELGAKTQRSAALAPVLKREQMLDQALRQQQAQAQSERVAAKHQERERQARRLCRA